MLHDGVSEAVNMVGERVVSVVRAAPRPAVVGWGGVRALGWCWQTPSKDELMEWMEFEKV